MAFRFSFISTLCLMFFASTISMAMAHGGHTEKPVEEKPVESIYSVDESPSEYSRENAEDPSIGLSGTNLFSDETPFDPEESTNMAPIASDAAHAGHMQQIKIATHEWIPTSSRGYGVAACFTFLSFVVFGVLWLKRPNE